jgi:hypothetical protein
MQFPVGTYLHPQNQGGIAKILGGGVFIERNKNNR